jgi:hypothetical protein
MLLKAQIDFILEKSSFYVVSKTACSTGWHGCASFWWEEVQIFCFPAMTNNYY